MKRFTINFFVLAWVIWRGMSDMLDAGEFPIDLVLVVIAATYLVSVSYAAPFARAVWATWIAQNTQSAYRADFRPTSANSKPTDPR